MTPETLSWADPGATVPRGRPARAVLAAAVLFSLVACSEPDEGMVVRNDTGVPVLFATGPGPAEPTGFLAQDFRERGIGPGESERVDLSVEDPGPPWSIWPLNHWAPAPCRDDLYLIAVSEDGRRFVHEPPLCADGEWILAE